MLCFFLFWDSPGDAQVIHCPKSAAYKAKALLLHHCSGQKQLFMINKKSRSPPWAQVATRLQGHFAPALESVSQDSDTPQVQGTIWDAEVETQVDYIQVSTLPPKEQLSSNHGQNSAWSAPLHQDTFSDLKATTFCTQMICCCPGKMLRRGWVNYRR